MEAQAFSSYLKELRLAKGLQLRTLSAQTGLDSSLLSRFEKGERLPTLPQLSLLAGALETDLKRLTDCWYCERVVEELKDYGHALHVLQMAGQRLSRPEIPEELQTGSLQALLERWQAERRLASDAYREKTQLIFTLENLALSGIRFSEQEALQILRDRRSIPGVGLDVQLALLNMAEAVQTIQAWARDAVVPDLERLHSLHALLVRSISSGGVFRSELTAIPGSAHIPPAPQDVPAAVGKLLDAYTRETTLHPIYRAAALHFRILQAHPYADANGRLARLLMQYALLCAEYPLIQTGNSEQSVDAYFRAVETAHLTHSAMPLASALLEWTQTALQRFFADQARHS